MAIVEAMADQILPIEADERLSRISDTAVATGSVKKGAAQQHQRKLERQADQKRPATVADLDMMGIKVVNSGT